MRAEIGRAAATAMRHAIAGRALALAATVPLLMTTGVGPLGAQAAPAGVDTGGRTMDWMIESAALAAPEGLREEAEVRAWTDDGDLAVLREGTNDIICLADRPEEPGFHAACYHASLEPFMERGRELNREGVPAAARNQVRWDEIEAGTLPMPVAGAVYNLGFADADFDPAEIDPATGSRLHAIYVSGATAESTGLPATPVDGPWLMLAGTPSAHVMISLPTRSAEDPGGTR